MAEVKMLTAAAAALAFCLSKLSKLSLAKGVWRGGSRVVMLSVAIRQDRQFFD